MNCHLCEAGASAKCKICERYVCSVHTVLFRHHYYDGKTKQMIVPDDLICSSCQETINTEAADKMARGKAVRICSFCDAEVAENSDFLIPEEEVPAIGYFERLMRAAGYPVAVAALPKCSVCSRRFCERHGQLLYYPYYRYEGKPTKKKYFHYCSDHLHVPNLLGKHEILRKKGLFRTKYMVAGVELTSFVSQLNGCALEMPGSD